MQMANDYDIGKAFAAIEDELIASMIRNMRRHKVEEVKEDKQWSMWQAEQLKSLERYKKANQKKYGKQFKDINSQIDELIRVARSEGAMSQEIAILNAIKQGFPAKRAAAGATAEFFKLNERKLEALIKATTQDIQKAEIAVLRMANDQYRKAIFNAQVYANSGAGTYEQAVDMATKDMLSAGLNCVEYKNGARHTLADYAYMAVQTASKRAYLQGEGAKRQEWGISTVIMNKRGNPCPKCLPWVGKVMIDDVWSEGSRKDGPYPLMSTAIAAGLYHPRCRDSHTTYFEGINTPPDDKYTRKELVKIEDNAKQEAQQQYAARQAEKFDRLAKYSLDTDNREQYQKRADTWKHVRFRTDNTDSSGYAESKRPLANFRAVPKEKVVDVLRKDSQEWIEQITTEEQRAKRKYTYNSGDRKPNRFFERLNAMLRGDLPEDKKLRDYAEIISGALKKNRLQHDVIAYRGVGIDPTDGFKIGEILVPGQFFSTSVVDTRLFGTGYKMVIYVKKGSNAAYIETLSHFPKQRELLIDKDCYYRVLSRKENIIELEVL